MSIESVLPSNHLVLCRPLLLLPSVFPSMRVLSKCTPPSTLFRLSRTSFVWLFHFSPAPGFLILRVRTHPVQHPLPLDSSGSSPEPFASRQSAPPSLQQPPRSYGVNLGPPETLALTPLALRGRRDRGPSLVFRGLGQPYEESGRRHLESPLPCSTLLPPQQNPRRLPLPPPLPPPLRICFSWLGALGFRRPGRWGRGRLECLCRGT